jgi:hypothetical protein
MMERFILFWQTTCEEDWNRAYKAFSVGVPTFLVNLSLTAWVKFLPLQGPGIATTVICGIGVIVLFWTSHMKWGTFLTESRQSDGRGISSNANQSLRMNVSNGGGGIQPVQSSRLADVVGGKIDQNSSRRTAASQ